MITVREAREITSKTPSSEVYWAGRVERKIKAVAGDGFYSTDIRVFDTSFTEHPEIQEYVKNKLLEAGFGVVITKNEDHTTVSVNWEIQNDGSVPNEENGGGAGV